MDIKVKKYKQEYEYSYTLGMAPTIELINNKKEHIYKVFVHPSYRAMDKGFNIFDICEENRVSFEVSQAVFNRIADKGNIFVIGVFFKYKQTLKADTHHTVLVNPSDSGNMGTIVRTGLGFGFEDIAVITPAVDIFDPRVLRASMGAVFLVNFAHYADFEDYLAEHKERQIYTLMLDGAVDLRETEQQCDKQISLVLGNESTGLSSRFQGYGQSVYIKHSQRIDSLNLSVAYGIAAHHFSSK